MGSVGGVGVGVGRWRGEERKGCHGPPCVDDPPALRLGGPPQRGRCPGPRRRARVCAPLHRAVAHRPPRRDEGLAQGGLPVQGEEKKKSTRNTDHQRMPTHRQLVPLRAKMLHTHQRGGTSLPRATAPPRSDTAGCRHTQGGTTRRGRPTTPPPPPPIGATTTPHQQPSATAPPAPVTSSSRPRAARCLKQQRGQPVKGATRTKASTATPTQIKNRAQQRLYPCGREQRPKYFTASSSPRDGWG